MRDESHEVLSSDEEGFKRKSLEQEAERERKRLRQQHLPPPTARKSGPPAPPPAVLAARAELNLKVQHLLQEVEDYEREVHAWEEELWEKIETEENRIERMGGAALERISHGFVHRWRPRLRSHDGTWWLESST